VPALDIRYRGVPVDIFAGRTVAIIAALALLPVNACAGIGAVTTGVRTA